VNARAWSEPRPAGFWIRAVALLVDVIVFFFVLASLRFVAGRLGGRQTDEAVVVQLVAVVFAGLFTALYTTLLHAFGGQTLGKLAAGIRVVGADGEPLSVGAAFLRYLASFVSTVPLALGFIMAGLRRDKRALHDLIAGSRVERLRGGGPRRGPRRADEPEPSAAP
jgi:uncharacterized RDD family membrane protein YckC